MPDLPKDLPKVLRSIRTTLTMIFNGGDKEKVRESLTKLSDFNTTVAAHMQYISHPSQKSTRRFPHTYDELCEVEDYPPNNHQLWINIYTHQVLCAINQTMQGIKRPGNEIVNTDSFAEGVAGFLKAILFPLARATLNANALAAVVVKMLTTKLRVSYIDNVCNKKISTAGDGMTAYTCGRAVSVLYNLNPRKPRVVIHGSVSNSDDHMDNIQAGEIYERIRNTANSDIAKNSEHASTLQGRRIVSSAVSAHPQSQSQSLNMFSKLSIQNAGVSRTSSHRARSQTHTQTRPQSTRR